MDNNGINIWKLPDHLQTCSRCHGSGEVSTALLPYEDDYRKTAGTWEDDSPKCIYCNGLGYIDLELNTQVAVFYEKNTALWAENPEAFWEAMGITPQQAVEDWDAALRENFGDEVLKQVQEIRKQQNEGLT